MVLYQILTLRNKTHINLELRFDPDLFLNDILQKSQEQVWPLYLIFTGSS